MKRALLVEGRDDKHVVLHIAQKRGIGLRRDEISCCGGIERLLDRIRVEIKNTKAGAIGVVVDADDDLPSRWTSIRDRLCQAGYSSVPTQPCRTGTVVSPPPEGSVLPKIGVWIMPDNDTSGTLEDFLTLLVPSHPENSLFEHAQNSVYSIPDDAVLFPKRAKAKALIHTWLAWQEEPGRPYGVAITKKFLDPNAPRVDVFVSWLNALFTL